MGDSLYFVNDALSARNVVECTEAGGSDTSDTEVDVARLVVPAQVEEFGKPGAFEDITSGGNDLGLKLIPKLHRLLNEAVNPPLDFDSDSRDWEIYDV